MQASSNPPGWIFIDTVMIAGALFAGISASILVFHVPKCQI